MNREALARMLGQTGATAPGAAAGSPKGAPPAPASDHLTPLLDTVLEDLTEPLAVDSALVARIYQVATEAQAEEVRARGGVPYAPAEVEILREIRAAVSREEWVRRLQAIHPVKVEFEGTVTGREDGVLL